MPFFRKEETAPPPAARQRPTSALAPAWQPSATRFDPSMIDLDTNDPYGLQRQSSSDRPRSTLLDSPSTPSRARRPLPSTREDGLRQAGEDQYGAETPTLARIGTARETERSSLLNDEPAPDSPTTARIRSAYSLRYDSVPVPVARSRLSAYAQHEPEPQARSHIVHVKTEDETHPYPGAWQGSEPAPAYDPPPNLTHIPLVVPELRRGNTTDSATSSLTATSSLYDDDGKFDPMSSVLSKTTSADTHTSQGRHYGPAPVGAQERRNPHGVTPGLQAGRRRKRKEIKLTEGNLVLDLRIPTRLESFLPRREDDEFLFTRYSAVTCDPDDFERQCFNLRPSTIRRECEILIGVTVYSENEVLFCRTMHGIMKNIAHLCTRDKSKVWGKDGWKKIVVCIVADGRQKIHPRVLDCLSALGVYQDGIAKNTVGEKIVTAHLYEHTTQLSIDPNMKFKGLEKGICPTQVMLLLKERNAKKINSHRWLFNAVAKQLNPNIAILIDVGTLPGPKSIYHLWKAFDRNSNVAGACGEIVTMKGKFRSGLLNPLVAAQDYEYKMSNILDKPFESVLGYISVLPGAFSAYRYVALRNDGLGHGPLATYFKGETLAGKDADTFTSNCYLAEDRILCWELVASPGHAWVLKYVKNAKGETDVPTDVAEFISQRRRWLNGAFFCAVFSILHFTRLLKTDHSKMRKLLLMFETLYNVLSLVFAFMSLSLYYLFFIILTTALEAPSLNLKGIVFVNIIAQKLYQATLIACFLLALGNRPQGSRKSYTAVMVIFAVLCLYMAVGAVFCIVKAVEGSASRAIFSQMLLSLICTYGSWFLASLIALDPWHMVTSMTQYLLLAPSYICVLNTYAFSNLHDFSWGTKDSHTVTMDLGAAVLTSSSGTVEMTMPESQLDTDGSYDTALHHLRTNPAVIPKVSSQSDRDRETEDWYRSVRTRVLLAWVLANGLLVSIVLGGDPVQTFEGGGGGGRTRVFMLVILVLVAIMSIVRFAGAAAYQTMRIFTG
ncbi:glycosyltransferase family 2 protein [Mixia osmundae IAM 14324]|uniref:Chitin synthase N-terminal domain-containing protein n=1 Tax=Mixia osmundae (strain CBS 9802 / IAM 14324 / JCM 22182 / KY 12970) TaxID=764103 RepID=G7DWQ3_MIXOS|nr:glycosyltransferase family 2 protein [Mixia osmundae IAM 14324]KEI36221.1 glycosyltransferase family 2 protein [Mixia osmundae IAM 14324]GAA95000.1 hypothetical protein E5Q_01655 [Mixia osmundae IAM 14324]